MKYSFFGKNTGYLRKKINEYLLAANQWFLKTPERALEQAYKAALLIKAIESEHFGGNKISADSNNYSDNVMDYLQADLEKQLLITKLKLADFKVSRSVVDISDSVFLEKLRLIDEVIEKYTSKKSTSSALVPISETVEIESNNVYTQSYSSTVDVNNLEISEKTGVLPRSIGRPIDKIKKDLDPKAEAEVVKKFRNSRSKTQTAVRFLLLLIIVTLLTQQVSKHFLLGPIVDRIRGENAPQIFANVEMKKSALRELQTFEEELKFASLINIAPQLSPEALSERVKHKAIEIAEEFRSKSSSAYSNVFAALLSLIAEGLVIVTSKREIIVLKSFLDDIVYGRARQCQGFFNYFVHRYICVIPLTAWLGSYS